MKRRGILPIKCQEFISSGAGFTLIEVTLAVLIFSIIAGAMYGLISGASRATQSGQEEIEITQLGWSIVEKISDDLRSAFTPDPVYGRTFLGEDDTYENSLTAKTQPSATASHSLPPLISRIYKS